MTACLRSSLVFNARAGYKFDNGLDVLNLFNAQTNQIEYYYLSRLAGKPLLPIAMFIRRSRSRCG